MRTVYLHIGMHKTGSTSIQKNFRGFDNGSIKFAELGFENHSIPFHTAFSGEHHSFPEWKLQNLSLEEVEEKKIECFRLIENSLKTDSNKDLIFSGEDISLISASGISQIEKLLRDYTDRVVVLAYIRDPLSFSASLLQEDIKAGINSRIPASPNYRFRFEKFVKIFGSENVHFRIFDPKRFENRDVVLDFADFLNVAPPNSRSVENASFSTEATRIIYILNNIISNTDEEKKLYYAKTRCLKELQRIFPGKFVVPRQIIEGSVSECDVNWLTKNNFPHDIRLQDRTEFSEPALKDYLEHISDDTAEKLLEFITSKGSSSSFLKTKENVVFRFFTAVLVETLSYKGFSPARYLELNPDVKAAGADPYRHFLEYGSYEGRQY